jgi:hypothetical protein
MNKLFFIFVILLCIQSSFAQYDANYIFGRKSNVKQSIFLGPELKLSRVIEGYQLYTGFKGGVLFNDKIAIGLSGGGFVTETVFLYHQSQSEKVYLNTIMGYGGFNIDYIVRTSSPVQLSFPMLVGAAGVALFTPDSTTNMIANDKLIEGGVFIIYEPGINLEVNITSFLRMGLGIGYRFAFGGDMDRVSPGDLSDFTFNLNIKLGSF